MGVEKDYIIRQIMMLFEVLQRVLRLKKQGKNDEAIGEINTFYSMLKIDQGQIQGDTEKFIHYLESGKNLTPQQMEIVGFVLKEQGDLENSPNSKLNLFSKAYFILERVERGVIDYSVERQMKMAELKELMEQLDQSITTE